MNEKEDCSQLAPYLLSTGSFTFTFLLLCLPRGSERKHHCLISDPRTLSQLPPHHHKGGASPGITLHILPHCTEGSPQSASHWACLCLTQNIWSHLRYNVLNILMSYLQLRLKLKKKGERDTFMSAFQFAELWINWASIMRLFFCEDETSQSPICPVLDLGLHRSYLGFKWFFFNGFWVNPIRAAQTLCSHPLNSSVVAGEGGTPSGQTPSALRNRECLMCINNNELLGWAAWKNSKQTEVV